MAKRKSIDIYQGDAEQNQSGKMEFGKETFVTILVFSRIIPRLRIKTSEKRNQGVNPVK